MRRARPARTPGGSASRDSGGAGRFKAEIGAHTSLLLATRLGAGWLAVQGVLRVEFAKASYLPHAPAPTATLPPLCGI